MTHEDVVIIQELCMLYTFCDAIPPLRCQQIVHYLNNKEKRSFSDQCWTFFLRSIINMLMKDTTNAVKDALECYKIITQTYFELFLGHGIVWVAFVLAQITLFSSSTSLYEQIIALLEKLKQRFPKLANTALQSLSSVYGTHKHPEDKNKAPITFRLLFTLPPQNPPPTPPTPPFVKNSNSAFTPIGTYTFSPNSAFVATNRSKISQFTSTTLTSVENIPLTTNLVVTTPNPNPSSTIALTSLYPKIPYPVQAYLQPQVTTSLLSSNQKQTEEQKIDTPKSDKTL
eukprot:TRINITY_DN6651_c0_g2_i1.p1 TRINITY_DN6651_c0_g2~~TRINITY_DN6651_c0_g2_i1.p1  ORF type:complete len:307 (-),score=42.50 TRINITY_DN6651_c0_g2_i1:41-895(-)